MRINEVLELAMTYICGECDCNDEYNLRSFRKIYPFINENINGYLKDYNLKGKKVLTVGSSADQILNSILFGCTNITCFDINPFVSCYYNLKKAAIQSLDYDEFLDFFCYENYPIDSVTNYNAFSLKVYRKISPYLDEKSRRFWDTLYLKYSGLEIKNSLFVKDEQGYEVLMESDSYLNPDNYYKLRDKIRNVRPRFITCDIKNICEKLNSKYDLIMLSNISRYLHTMYDKDLLENYRDLIEDISRFLTPDGEIFFGYLYDYKQGDSYQDNWAKIYNIDEVLRVFNAYDVFLKTFIGIKGILLGNDSIKDSVLVCKKRK
jgi:hypothetical protein